MAKKPILNVLGTSVPRKEGVEKVTGRAQYIDDIEFPNCWQGITIRSTIPRGRIQSITFSPLLNWAEYCIVQASDILGVKEVALIETDQPFLASDKIEHAAEPILLIAHPTREGLQKAFKGIKITYSESEPELDFEKSKTIFKSYKINKGSIHSVWSLPDVIIVEGTYYTGAQEHLYIETNGVVAEYSDQSGVTVWGSMQCPYYVHKALKSLFALPDEKIRVIQTETGGGFGGKEEYPSLISGHAALLAKKCGHAVRMVYDRSEDMVATTKRHPSRTIHKTAVSKAGKLLGMEIDFLLDGGAYVTLSPVVLSRGTIHAAGPYLCENIKITSQVVKTNTAPHGAFRGFGAPQSLFALERHMDAVAKAVGLSPDEFRRRNFLKANDQTATGQTIRQNLKMNDILEKALELSQWQQKRKLFKKSNQHSIVKKGIGIATFMHGAGFTGSGERTLNSRVAVEATDTGKIRVLTANTEIGQGTNTIFSQIVSDTLGIPYDWVLVAQPDTSNVPNSGPTVASRTCMIVGSLVRDAALDLKSQLVKTGLLKESFTPEAFRSAINTFQQTHGTLRGKATYQQPDHINWDDNLYRGDAYGAFAWAAYVAEVSVDMVTFSVSVDHFVAVQEVGRVVHPVLAEGQIIGGVVQGIGWALYENVVWKEGKMQNASLTNYIIPTTQDVPPIQVHFLEEKYAHGPGGAKGIGELPLDGPAPAILNAIEHAIGISINQIPCLPETILKSLEANS